MQLKLFSHTVLLILFVVLTSSYSLEKSWDLLASPQHVNGMVWADDTLWMATQLGVVSYDKIDSGFALYDLSDNLPHRDVVEIFWSEGTLFAKFREGGGKLYARDGSSWNIISESGSEYKVHADGMLWKRMGEEGVAQYSQGRWIEHSFEQFTYEEIIDTIEGTIRVFTSTLEDSIVISPEGNYWVCTDSTVEIFSSDKVHESSLNIVEPKLVEFTPSGSALVNFRETYIAYYDCVGDTFSYYEDFKWYDDGNIAGIRCDDDSSFWYYTYKEKVYHIDVETMKEVGEFKLPLSLVSAHGVNVKHKAEKTWNDDFSELLFGDNGNLWMAHGLGVIEFDPNSEEMWDRTFAQYPTEFASPTGLVKTDLDEVIVATKENLFSIAEEGITPYKITSGNGKSLIPGNEYDALSIDSDGLVWIYMYEKYNTSNGYLASYYQGDWTTYNLNFPSEETVCTGISPSIESGVIWVGSSAGLYKWNESEGVKLVDPKITLPVTAQKEDAHGTVWVGLENANDPAGACLLTVSSDGQINTIIDPSSDLLVQISALNIDQLGAVWIGGYAKSKFMEYLRVYTYSNGEIDTLLSETIIPEGVKNSLEYSMPTQFMFDGDKTWMSCTDWIGMNYHPRIYSFENGNYIAEDTSVNSPNGYVVNSIIKDGEGRAWCAVSGLGLYVLQEDGNEIGEIYVPITNQIELQERSVRLLQNGRDLMIMSDHISAQSKELSLFNLQGRLILQESFSESSHRVSLSTLSAGMYLLRLNGGHTSINSRIIIQ